MEPVETARVKYVIYTHVLKVDEEFEVLSTHKVGDRIVVDERSLGWLVLLDGSHEKIHLGHDKPDLVAGDKVKITIERVK